MITQILKLRLVPTRELIKCWDEHIRTFRQFCRNQVSDSTLLVSIFFHTFITAIPVHCKCNFPVNNAFMLFKIPPRKANLWNINWSWIISLAENCRSVFHFFSSTFLPIWIPVGIQLSLLSSNFAFSLKNSCYYRKYQFVWN